MVPRLPPALPLERRLEVRGSGGSGFAGPLAAGPSGAGSASDRGALEMCIMGFMPEEHSLALTAKSRPGSCAAFLFSFS